MSSKIFKNQAEANICMFSYLEIQVWSELVGDYSSLWNVPSLNFISVEKWAFIVHRNDIKVVRKSLNKCSTSINIKKVGIEARRQFFSIREKMSFYYRWKCTSTQSTLTIMITDIYWALSVWVMTCFIGRKIFSIPS